MQFTFTPNYPDEIPEIEIIENSDNLDQSDIDELFNLLEIEANSNVGMVMVFTLVSSASEWLIERRVIKEKEKLEHLERKQRELEESELIKFEGTRVTVETFLTWKHKFDEEMASLRKETCGKELNIKKLTGRLLFEKDRSLYESDLQFLEEGDLVEDVTFGGADVKVDETLFQDLDIDDLDLNE